MEGVLAGECYKQAKEEGCYVDTVWQDGDSSSAKSVTEYHSNSKVYKCGGHVGRAHTNNLKEAAKKMEFSDDIAQKFKDKFPNIKTLKCKCERHKSGCGCLSETFIKGARINHFCILQQCKSPEDYAEHMRVVFQYHCRDIHSWDEGSSGFHPQCSCSCNQCDEDEEPSCEGKEYHTKVPLQQQAFRTIAALIMEPLRQLLPNRMFCSFTARCSSSVHDTSAAAGWHSSTIETSIAFSRIAILLKLFLLTPKYCTTEHTKTK